MRYENEQPRLPTLLAVIADGVITLPARTTLGPGLTAIVVGPDVASYQIDDELIWQGIDYAAGGQLIDGQILVRNHTPILVQATRLGTVTLRAPVAEAGQQQAEEPKAPASTAPKADGRKAAGK